MRTLATLAFDNSYARLPEPFGQRVAPVPLPAPRLLHFNRRVAALLDLDPDEAIRADFAQHVGGDRLPPGAEPVAMAYAGHQFGSYVPQLGDGRALLLGEVVNARGERWDLHLKGSGPTRWSRGFDGRSVLRSAIREYLAGEALHALGIPTTRALCLVASDLPVVRESVETAAAIVRVAPTHVRFGSFEYFAWQGQPEAVRRLADWVIERHFPHLRHEEGRHARWFREVCERTARLMARWQAAGFTHGVMNTDNFSITGHTLDFGPYAFLDRFEPDFTPNHSDPEGRYAFDRQPGVGRWNCAALAEAVVPLMTEADAADALDAFAPAFEREYLRLLRAKLGLRTAEADDLDLAAAFLGLLQAARADYHLAFRRLSLVTREGGTPPALLEVIPAPAPLADWLARYRARLAREGSDDGARAARMDRVNPLYVLRTHLAQAAIAAAQAGDPTELARLLELVSSPFDEVAGCERYAAAPAAEACGVALSCSS